jgi:NAD(P)-dependent dehydrogenase (short-subunit alcohol dehydrogenase family)
LIACLLPNDARRRQGAELDEFHTEALRLRQTMTRLVTPFGARSTAEEVVAGCDLSGKRVIVTGATSGIGVETARALARAGAEVTLAVRDVEAGARTALDITASTGNRSIHVVHLDLSDQTSVANFVAAWDRALHVLINNAGVMALPVLHHSREGWEMQFATNHLGHFALARGLHGALAAAGTARIVAVSSSAHLRSPVVFDDIHFARRPYDPILAYAQSKTANVLFAVGATARWKSAGITANALHPGAIPTNLQRHTGGSAAATSRTATRPFPRSTRAKARAVSRRMRWTPTRPSTSGKLPRPCFGGAAERRGQPENPHQTRGVPCGVARPMELQCQKRPAASFGSFDVRLRGASGVGAEGACARGQHRREDTAWGRCSARKLARREQAVHCAKRRKR